MASQDLGSKERSLFTQVVRLYENKQYKKGLKTAEQILRKKPNHGDTIAMKALIINGQGDSDTAFALAKTALQHSMKSHVCWHVYGLLYRANKNFDEAIKAYKFALKLEPDSNQIQKDLAVLQIQMRDYAGYVQTRRIILQNKKLWRQNWTALAIAQHLAGDLWEAERTLTTYEETLRSPPPRSDMEHAEAILYKNTIIAEMGETERALDHLKVATKTNPDRGWVMEKRAEYLLQLDRKSDAERAYRELLERNPERRAYYDGLIAAKGLQDSEAALKQVFQEYAEKNPRGDAARRIPLEFLEGDDFREAADQYLRKMLAKGVPSTFANIKALYSDKDKKDRILNLAEEYLKVDDAAPVTNGDTESKSDTKPALPAFKPAVHYFLAQHYNYFKSRDLQKAMEHIDEAIKTDPKSVDFQMTKARIWKHQGDLRKAVETMEHARELDTRDRYINSKAAKYQLRNDENEAAIQNMGKFTRNEAVGGPLGDLHDMQCQWYIYEDGQAYARQGKLGLALKRFHSIYDIFEIWQEDQFDFHSFSLRKGQIRAYIDMLRWQDHLREHPYFARAAIAAANIYIKLFDHPDSAHGDMVNGVGDGKMSAAEKKKAQKKARKEQERKAQEEALKKDAKKNPNLDQNGDVKKVDKDPQGEELLRTTEPLEQAMKFINPLLEFSPNNLEAQQMAFEVYLRRSKTPHPLNNSLIHIKLTVLPDKPILALRSLRAAEKLAPTDPTNHHQKFAFLQQLKQQPPSLTPKADEIFKSEVSSLPDSADNLSKMNDGYLQKHHESAAHVQAALQVRAQVLEPDAKEQASQDMIRVLALDSCTLAEASKGLKLLRDWQAPQKHVELYIDAAHQRFPHATAFKDQLEGAVA